MLFKVTAVKARILLLTVKSIKARLEARVRL
jgi:hypothetical protein